jgi:hypothetical protein
VGQEHCGAVADLLAEYRLAVRGGNQGQLAEIFHPTATVSYPEESTGLLMTTSATDFAEEVACLVRSGQVVNEQPSSVHIDTVGAIASARVDFLLQIGDEWFAGTDFFSLARLGSRWWITQKLYDMTRRDHAVTTSVHSQSSVADADTMASLNSTQQGDLP